METALEKFKTLAPKGTTIYSIHRSRPYQEQKKIDFFIIAHKDEKGHYLLRITADIAFILDLKLNKDGEIVYKIVDKDANNLDYIQLLSQELYGDSKSLKHERL